MNHTPFIVASYVVALLGFGGLVIASLVARRKAKRELSVARAGPPMKPKRKRLWLLVASLAVLGAAVALVLSALSDNLVFFYSPTQVAEKHPGPDRRLRIGGLVEQGSVKKDGQEVRFVVTDLKKTVAVVYRGLLPDLFREGQGVIAEGTLGADGVFTAREVLAKHDEKYMPPEVAKALKESGRWQEGSGKQ